MTNTYIPISLEQHKGKSWKRSKNYLFASEESVCALALNELPAATLSLPLAFLELDGHFTLASLQGFEKNKNLLTNSNGQWLAGYVPANYRAFPFTLLGVDEEQKILCIEQSSCVEFGTEDSEAIFDNDNLSPLVASSFEMIIDRSKNIEALSLICDFLNQKELIVPWPITIDIESKKTEVKGLFRIDEEAFKKLSSTDLVEARDMGALPVVYCQLLSMRNISLLLVQHKLRSNSKVNTSIPEIQFDSTSDSGSISFDNL